MNISVFDEIVDFMVGREPSRILAFHPSPSTQERVELLLYKKHQGNLSAKEQSELEYFRMLEHIVRLAKAKALKASNI
ncbi:MAG: hypothetical protein AAF806_18835 [Bacteroidota bacterium]